MKNILWLLLHLPAGLLLPLTAASGRTPDSTPHFLMSARAGQAGVLASAPETPSARLWLRPQL